MKSLSARIRKLIHNEQGAIGIVVLVIVFIAMLLVPFFIDIASVQYSRSKAQTGTDAAAMAAAVQLARDLSLCTETGESDWYRNPEQAKENRRRKVINDYYDHYSRVVNGGAHRQAAEQYARANVNNLRNWQYGYSSGKSTSIEGKTFYDIRPFVRFSRPVQAFTKEISKRGFDTPAQATSEAYLDNKDIRAWVSSTKWVCDVYCETGGCCAGHWEYKARASLCVEWKVRLIK